MREAERSKFVFLNLNALIWVATRPTGDASAWKQTPLAARGQFIGAVGCARGATLCVAAVNGVGGSAPQLLTTTKPAAGRSSWSAAPAPGPATWISCPSTALCVGISYDNILASANPSAGGASWTTAPLLPTGFGTALTALDCGSTSRCTAAVSDGTVLTSSDPAGGAAALWRDTTNPHENWGGGLALAARAGATLGDLHGRGQRLRQVGEQLRHLGAALEAMLRSELAAVAVGYQLAFGDA